MKLLKYALVPAALAFINLAQAADIQQTVPFDTSMNFGDSIVVNYDLTQAAASKVVCTAGYNKVWASDFDGQPSKTQSLPVSLKVSKKGKVGVDQYHWGNANGYFVTSAGSFKITTVPADGNEPTTFKVQCAYKYNNNGVIGNEVDHD